MQLSHSSTIKLATLILASSMVLSACMPSQTTQNSPTPSPAVAFAQTTAEVRTAIDEGAAAREKGEYATGETKLGWAFDSAVALQDKALAIEAGNNVSIQYRLSAGRASRQGDNALAQKFSGQSLDVYQKLKNLGWFDEKDPNIARNWAHALLYAGKIDEAISALQASLAIQTAPAAQGDESNHLAAAYIAQGKLAEAEPLFSKGISLIEKNNGSKIWLTFGLMTKATWQVKKGNEAGATKSIQQALDIAEKNALLVRKEELTHLSSIPVKEVDVLKTVGSPQ